jgi:hypothetical protein
VRQCGPVPASHLYTVRCAGAGSGARHSQTATQSLGEGEWAIAAGFRFVLPRDLRLTGVILSKTIDLPVSFWDSHRWVYCLRQNNTSQRKITRPSGQTEIQASGDRLLSHPLTTNRPLPSLSPPSPPPSVLSLFFYHTPFVATTTPTSPVNTPLATT